MWFGVSNTGKSVLLALCLVEKEEVGCFAKVAQSFIRCMGALYPQTLIIER